MDKRIILIASFSRTGRNYAGGNLVNLPVGSTAVTARKPHALTGGDLLPVEQREIYPEDHHRLTEVAKGELREGARPGLKSALPDMAGKRRLYKASFGGYKRLPVNNITKP